MSFSFSSILPEESLPVSPALNAAGVLAEALERAPETDTVTLDEALDSGTVLVDEHGADVVLQVHDVTVHVRK